MVVRRWFLANDQRPTTDDQMKFRASTRNNHESGYILLTLMLFVTILVITAAVVVPEVTFQVKRDREEELIHRGVQYSRAIRRYVKKFGRYPTRIEELENTNNIRFLRRRYKDPITGKDFRILRQGDVQMFPGAGGIAGAAPMTTPLNPQSSNTNPKSGTLVSGDQSGDQSGSQPSSSGDTLSGQVFGGGPILGVASMSKEQTIREFNHKNHYNQWQFIYDPSTDRGGLLNTPAQPPLQGAVPVAGAPATGLQPTQPGGPQQNPPQPPPQNTPPPDQQQQQQ